MIKRLRRQFIGIAMGSMLFITIVVVSAINLTGYFSVMDDTDKLLLMLSDNQGVIPGMMKDEFSEQKENAAPPPNDFMVQDNQNNQNNQNNQYGGQINAETQFRTRFFSVSYDLNGNVIEADMTHIAAIDEETAISYGNHIVQNKEAGTFGTKDIYRYYVNSEQEKTTIYFLDCRQEIDSTGNLLRNSCLVGLLSLITELIFIVIMSKKVTQPVASSIERQKRFITDASHEIKTPLAIISANAEVIDMKEGKSEWTESIVNQTKRLNKLVMNMIELSKMDEEKPPLEKNDFCISDAIYDTANSFLPLAKKNGKELELLVEENIYYYGDEGSIRELTSILVDNAIKYSTESGKITVSLSGRKKIVFKVTNPYYVQKEDEPEKIFERFYRMENSRSRETGGFGIGLSIAKAVVEAHKGKIDAKEEPQGFMTITVELR